MSTGTSSNRTPIPGLAAIDSSAGVGRVITGDLMRTPSCDDDERATSGSKSPAGAGLLRERLKGLEPSTFCMAIADQHGFPGSLAGLADPDPGDVDMAATAGLVDLGRRGWLHLKLPALWL
jgi:hypothetical protein